MHNVLIIAVAIAMSMANCNILHQRSQSGGATTHYVDDDSGLGAWKNEHYASKTLPTGLNVTTRYELTIRHREYSGDGSFTLLIETIDGKTGERTASKYEGTRNTQRGTPADNNATLWQLVDRKQGKIFNFLSRNNGCKLLLLDSDFEVQTPTVSLEPVAP